MGQPVPLTKEKHGNLKVLDSTDFTRYKNQHLIPIVVQDFYTLSAEFPLVFVKNETDDFVAVAVMGFKEGVNLYCQTGEWSAHVIPAGFGNAPFSVAILDESGEKLAVCVDEDSPLLSEERGEPLFDEQGEQTEYLKMRMDSVVRVAEQTRQSQSFCRYLASKNLLAPRQLNIQRDQQGKKYVIDGIYTVDEDVLQELPIEEFDKMRKNGLLGLIFAHLTSLNQIKRLSQKQFKADIEEEQRAAEAAGS